MTNHISGIVHTLPEGDPVFLDWDRSGGITINESQIADLKAYLTSETDPNFVGWNKTDGILIAQSQLSDLSIGEGCIPFADAAGKLIDDVKLFYDKSSDRLALGHSTPARMFHMQGRNATYRIDRDTNSPAVQLHRFPSGDFTTPWKGFMFRVDATGPDEGTFSIVDYHQAVTGGGDERLIIDTDGKIIIPGDLDVGSVIAALDGDSDDWNAAYGWGNHASVGYLTGESDPVFSAWNKSTGISITESQVSDLSHTPVFDGNIAAIYNSLGLFKIQPDAQDDVEFFGDTDIASGVNGKILKVWRRSSLGNKYIRLYVGSGETGYIHANCPLTLQSQVPFTINSVTDSIYFKVGDNAGLQKVYFKDSDGAELLSINSNGYSKFYGEILIQGYDGFSSLGETAALYLGDTQNWIKATHSDLTEFRCYSGLHISDSVNGVFATFKNAFFGLGTDEPVLPIDIRSADDNQAMFFDKSAQAAGVGGGIMFGGKYTDAGAEAMSGRIGTQKTNGTSGHVGFDMVLETQDSEGTITERIKFLSNALCGLNLDGITPTKTLDVGGNGRYRGDLTIDDQLTVANIESSGNLVAGGGSSNFRVSAYINRTTGIVRSARFQTDGNHVDARGISIWAGEDTESGTNYWLEAYDGDGGTLTGGLRSVGGTFDVFNSSDKRLKRKIKNTKIVGKDIIMAFRITDFELKKNRGHRITGMIAQEARKAYYPAVGEPDNETGFYSISNGPIIPVIIKHNQEQQNQLDTIEKRLTKLEIN